MNFRKGEQNMKGRKLLKKKFQEYDSVMENMKVWSRDQQIFCKGPDSKYYRFYRPHSLETTQRYIITY